MSIEPAALQAIRATAALVWQSRDKLALTSAQKECALISMIAAGTDAEGEAASSLLSSLRETEKRQENFDRLLSGEG